MKKHGILNSDISRVLAYLGHTDRIGIADCGLPIPPEVERIDLAIEPGFPEFDRVLAAVARDMVIEHAVLAEEIKDRNPDLLAAVQALLPASVTPEFVSHEDFKALSRNCRAIVRTGEATPYANVILQAGVVFAGADDQEPRHAN